MIISIIVAISKNNAIGKNNDLLWHLPNDLKYFKSVTENHHIVTGRKSYESIPAKYRPLTNRTNLVVSRNTGLQLEDGVHTFTSIENALQFAKNNDEKEVFIIGGGQIYKQSLDIADKLYITEVDVIFEDAEVFFPKIDARVWGESSRNSNKTDEKHLYNYDFVTYERK